MSFSASRSRRTTLGSMDVNANHGAASTGRRSSGRFPAKSRASMGAPTRVSSGYGKNSGGGARNSNPLSSSGGNRPSSQQRRTTSLSRRSSVLGKSSSKNADPRPINNKQYMQEEIHHLITYLMEMDYQQRISSKILTQPTARDFANIVTFLFQLVDSNYKPSGRIEDDVPAVFKALKYPFGISKTALTAVGSPHTWPALLASISWLIELLEYDREVQKSEEERNANGDDDQAFFFNYLRDSYQAFLSGDDDAYDALDQQIAATFEEKYAAMENEMKELEEGNEKLRKQIEDMKSEESPLPTLKSKKEDYESDQQTFERLIEQLEQHKAALEKKRDARQAEYDEQVQRRRDIENQLAEVKEILNTQELSPSDVDSLRKRQQELSNEENKLLQEKDELKTEISDCETKLSETIQELSDKVDEYRESATALDLLNESSQTQPGVNFSLEVDNSALTSVRGLKSQDTATTQKNITDIIGEDPQNKLIPALKSHRNKLSKKTTTVKTQIIETKDQLDQKKEANENKLQEIKDVEKNTSQLEHEYSKEKATFDKHQNSHTGNMDTLEEQISAARERKLRNEELAREYDDTYIDTRAAEAEAEKSSLKEKEQGMQKRIDDAFGKLIKHKQRVDGRLEDVTVKYQHELEKVNGQSQLGSSSSSVFRHSQHPARPPAAHTASDRRHTQSSNFRVDLDASDELDDEGLLYVDEQQ